jgi:methylated-DNA-protein-cysteine methyltransferase-like protein
VQLRALDSLRDRRRSRPGPEIALGGSRPGPGIAFGEASQDDPAARAERIIARVRAIPEGFVQTYGDIDPRAPRLVGRVLANLPDSRARAQSIPWHRVVRADGRAPVGARQLALLRREGVPVRGDRVDLGRARLPREHI